MTLKEQLAQLQKDMRAIMEHATSGGREITDDEMTELEAKSNEAIDLKARIERSEKAGDILSGIGTAADEEAPEPAGGTKARSLGDFAKDAGMFDRWRSGAGRREASTGTEFKAATDPFLVGGLGQTQYGQPVNTRLRRLTIADLFASGSLSGSSLTYPQQGPVTGVPGAVAEGAAKPQINFAWANVNEVLSKLAAITKVSDESMEDTPYLISVINAQLVQRLQIVEEDQLLNGNGTAPNIRGILQRPGIQTTGTAGDPAANNLDTIFHAITLVETGPAFAPTDGIVVNPVDYEKFRLSKDTNEQYYGGGPFTGAYGNDGIAQQPGIWGYKTVVTPAISAGTVLVGSFSLGGQVFRKGGIRVDSTNSDVNDFQNNLVALRAEERLLLAVYYPTAFVKVTLGTA
jgi:HK97 family phage major capsid protein